MPILTLLRHGESLWNLENRFTGWTDVDLTEQGVTEAHQAAAALTQEGLIFDIAFTSVLKRAIRTLWIVALNIPTGIPLVYELDKNLKPVSHRYLGDPQVVAAAIKGVAHQGQVK